jgi:hypothetical protein
VWTRSSGRVAVRGHDVCASSIIDGRAIAVRVAVSDSFDCDDERMTLETMLEATVLSFGRR